MKKLTTLAMLGALAFSTQAFAETPSENEREIKADKGAIAKDNAAIRKQEQNLEKNRAEKAAAKANKNYGTQAKESVSIGANKATIAAKKGERKVDNKILEKDQNDRQDYSSNNYDRSNQYGNASPSAGRSSNSYGDPFSPYPPHSNYRNDSRDGMYPVSHKEGPAAKL